MSYKEFPLDQCSPPSREQSSLATQFKIRDWLAIKPKHVDDIKGQIASGNPVIIGIAVKETLESLGPDGVYRGAGKEVGFHALTIVGYDDQKQAFKVINSWGTQWAAGGFGWISYDVFQNDVLEAYIIRVQEKPIETSSNVVPKRVVPIEITKNNVEIISPRIVVKPKPKQQESIVPVEPVDRPVQDSDCANVLFEEVGKRVVLTGYAPTESDINLIERSNRGKPVDVHIDVRPWPQCEFLGTLGPLLSRADAPEISTKGKKTKFTEGDLVSFEVKAPRRPSYLYVAYIQADGKVLMIHQPASELVPEKSSERLKFGDGTAGAAKYRVTGPYGRETLIALAAESPLFQSKLPKEMTERDFLSQLRKAILYKSDLTKSPRDISAAFLGLEISQ